MPTSEKLTHLQHEEWLARRPKASGSLIAKALAVLDRPPNQPLDQSDRLPRGYKPVRRKKSVGKVSGLN